MSLTAVRSKNQQTKTSNSVHKRQNKVPAKSAQVFASYFQSRIRQGVTNRSRLYREVQEQGYIGHYASVYRYINKMINELNSNRYKQSIRFETSPGEQAQVDWGHFGKIEVNGREQRLYCFVYILGFSRAMYVEFTIKQNLPTLLNCHINAFNRVGIPKTIVYDNMKTVVLTRSRLPDGTPRIEFNPALLAFAKYYNFIVDPTAPYWPRSKGKVESAVKFVRNNFMQGMRQKKQFYALDDLNDLARNWVDNYANKRLHGTTHERPTDRWLEEKPMLSFPKHIPQYETAMFQPRFSTKDASISYKSCVYPVPYEYARRKVYIKELSRNGIVLIEIYHENLLIATYTLLPERNKWIKESDAIFFKSKTKRENKKRTHMKNRYQKQAYPNIPSRPIDYYNRVIAGGILL